MQYPTNFNLSLMKPISHDRWTGILDARKVKSTLRWEENLCCSKLFSTAPLFLDLDPFEPSLRLENESEYSVPRWSAVHGRTLWVVAHAVDLLGVWVEAGSPVVDDLGCKIYQDLPGFKENFLIGKFEFSEEPTQPVVNSIKRRMNDTDRELVDGGKDLVAHIAYDAAMIADGLDPADHQLRFHEDDKAELPWLRDFVQARRRVLAGLPAKELVPC